MRLVHYGDAFGGGIIIISAPKSHIKELQAFLHDELKIDVKRIPRRAPRRTGIKLGRWILPPARTTNKTLIPPPREYPCNICEFARYNQLCQHQKNCAVFAYWTIRSANQMPNRQLPFLSGEQKALIESIVAKYVDATSGGQNEGKRQPARARNGKGRGNHNQVKRKTKERRKRKTTRRSKKA
jgi:hypothetical protein